MSNGVKRDDLKRVHERIDDLQENRLEDLKDTNECLTKIKKSIASIESSLERQKETLDNLSSKTDDLADKRKDWDSVIDEKIEMHQAECPATDLMNLKKDGFLGGAKNFGRKHPFITGGGGAAVATALIKLASELLNVFG